MTYAFQFKNWIRNYFPHKTRKILSNANVTQRVARQLVLYKIEHVVSIFCVTNKINYMYFKCEKKC